MKRIKFFWRWFHKRYGLETVTRLSFPMRLLSRFDYHYFLYDEKGDVKDGAANIFEAVKKSKETGLYISKCWD